MPRKGKGRSAGYKGGGGGSSRWNGAAPVRPSLTHFLCIPLANADSTPQLERSLENFRNLLKVENEGADSPVSLSAVRPVGTIHFTLGIMSLTTEETVAEAVRFLESLDVARLMNEIQDISDDEGRKEKPSEGLRISLTSLHSMHTPTNTSVLYTGPGGSPLLYPLCVQISLLFQEKGFVLSEDRPLKLHATVLNTVYGKSKAQGGRPDIRQSLELAGSANAAGVTAENSKLDISAGRRPKARNSMRIDATSLLEKCNDMVWAADFPLERLAICKMGAKKIMDENGVVVGEEYEEVASIAMPD